MEERLACESDAASVIRINLFWGTYLTFPENCSGLLNESRKGKL